MVGEGGLAFVVAGGSGVSGGRDGPHPDRADGALQWGSGALAASAGSADGAPEACAEGDERCEDRGVDGVEGDVLVVDGPIDDEPGERGQCPGGGTGRQRRPWPARITPVSSGPPSMKSGKVTSWPGATSTRRLANVIAIAPSVTGARAERREGWWVVMAGDAKRPRRRCRRPRGRSRSSWSCRLQTTDVLRWPDGGRLVRRYARDHDGRRDVIQRAWPARRRACRGTGRVRTARGLGTGTVARGRSRWPARDAVGGRAAGDAAGRVPAPRSDRGDGGDDGGHPAG